MADISDIILNNRVNPIELGEYAGSGFKEARAERDEQHEKDLQQLAGGAKFILGAPDINENGPVAQARYQAVLPTLTRYGGRGHAPPSPTLTPDQIPKMQALVERAQVDQKKAEVPSEIQVAEYYKKNMTPEQQSRADLYATGQLSRPFTPRLITYESDGRQISEWVSPDDPRYAQGTPSPGAPTEPAAGGPSEAEVNEIMTGYMTDAAQSGQPISYQQLQQLRTMIKAQPQGGFGLTPPVAAPIPAPDAPDAPVPPPPVTSAQVPVSGPRVQRTTFGIGLSPGEKQTQTTQAEQTVKLTTAPQIAAAEASAKGQTEQGLEYSKTIRSKADAATSEIVTLKQVGDVAALARTGFGGAGELALRKAALAFGVGDAETIAAGETLVSFGNKLATSLKSDLPGPMSNADREFLVVSVPNISMTPAGIQKLIQMRQKVNTRAVAQGAYVDTLLDRGVDPRQVRSMLRAWSNANPIFPAAKASNSSELEAAMKRARAGYGNP